MRALEGALRESERRYSSIFLNSNMVMLIVAPAERIFDLIVDPSRHRDFDGSGTVREATEGAHRLALGDTFGMSMKMGIGYQMVSEVVEFEENRRLAWQTRPTVSLAIGVAMGAFLVYYVLLDWHSLTTWVGRHMGLDPDTGSAIVGDAVMSVRRYFGSLTLSAVVTAVLIGGAAFAMDVPLAFTIAVITLVTSYIPYLGAIGLLTNADLALAQSLPILLIYNLIFILPPTLLLVAYRLFGERLQSRFERYRETLQRGSRETWLWILGIVGFFLLADSLRYFEFFRLTN